MPAFDGLLPAPHNNIVLTLIFRLAEWHALAKLHMHTDTTMLLLDSATTNLGQELRRFSRTTCAFYLTQELPAEKAARGRRQARKKAKAGVAAVELAAPLEGTPAVATSSNVLGDGPPPLSTPSEQITADVADLTADTMPPTKKPAKRKGPSKKAFNMWRYKVHALGDYVETIRRHGTTDSYSSQTVTLRSIQPHHVIYSNLFYRENSNIAELKDYMHVQTRDMQFVRSPGASVVKRGCFAPGELPKQSWFIHTMPGSPTTMLYHLPIQLCTTISPIPGGSARTHSHSRGCSPMTLLRR